jgi:hypothetical protein
VRASVFAGMVLFEDDDWADASAVKAPAMRVALRSMF